MEESFPRGGALVTARKRKSPEQTPEKGDLFKTEEPEVSASKKKKLIKLNREQQRMTKKRQQVKDSVVKLQTPAPDTLQRKNLSVGMLVLGCVKTVHDFELIISLPNCLSGVVSITNISDAYTDLLRNLTSVDLDAMTTELDVSSLHDLFYPGQVITAKVVEVPKFEKKKSKASMIKLTLNPREIHESLTVSLVKHGMVLCCSVASREDHGYVLDLGLSGASSFIKMAEVEQYIKEHNEGKSLAIGSCLRCMVATEDKETMAATENRLIKVTIVPRKVNKSHIKESMGLNLQTMIPGMTVEAKITKVMEEGVNVAFLSYTGTIHHSHLQTKPSKCQAGDKMKAAILYIHSTLKVVTLTQLPHLVTPDPTLRTPFGDIVVGDIFEEAKILKVDKSIGVIFVLPSGARAIAKKSHLSDKEVTDMKGVFKKGNTHRCRVVNFDYADNVILVTLRESVLNQKYLKYSDIAPASIVECQVCAIHRLGISVKLTNHIRGYIPNVHLSDVPLRNPEKKFKVDDSLKCKVLAVDIEKSRLYLTNKKSLISTKHEDLTHYDQCTPGLITEGFVFKILNNGLVVKFYGRVQGFVPKGDLSTEYIEFPEKVFYIGQVVKCRIKNCDPENQKLFLSLKISGRVPFGVKAVEAPDDFKIGKLVDCRIKEKTEMGFDVVLLPSKISAVLPKAHLSDNHGNCEMLYQVHKKGDVIHDAMYLGKRNIILLTKKQCLLKPYRENTSILTFEDLQPGMLLPAVVKKKMEYGLFVDVGHGLIGLAPNKYISSKKLVDPSQLFDLGQSLIVKVAEVDADKQRFLVSLRMSDCYHGDLDDGLDLLTLHCDEFDEALQLLKQRKGVKQRLSAFSVGEIVTMSVTKVTDQGVLCCHDNGIKGFMTIDHMTGVVCTEGEQIKAVVLYLDPAGNCLELTVNPELISAIQNFKDNKFSQVKVTQLLKSEVQLIKDSFVLVSLKGHARGRFAYLPARKHLNDSLEKHQFVVGQVNPVIIKKIHGNYTITCLKIHDDESSSCHLSQKEMAMKEGEVATVEVTHVHDLQLNVKVDGRQGRIHITEVKDQPEQGENVLKCYTVGQSLEAKIIGFRTSENHKKKSLQSSKPKPLVEFSVRSSRMAMDSTAAQFSDVYSPGDTVQAFVTGTSHYFVWMTVGLSQRGRVHILDLGKTTKESTSKFVVGACYRATVVGVKDEMLDLSLLDEPWEVETGSKTLGLVRQILPDGSLSIQLPLGHRGTVQTPDISDTFTDTRPSSYSIDQCLKCYVLRCDDAKLHDCALSLRKSRLKEGKKVTVKDREVSHIHDLQQKTMVRGIVRNNTSNTVVLSLGTEVSGSVSSNHLSKYFVKSVPGAFPLGKVCSAKILSIKGESVELSLLEEDTGLPDSVPSTHRGSLRITDEEKRQRQSDWKQKVKARKRKLSGAGEGQGHPKKGRDSDDDTTDSGVDSEDDSDSDTKIPLVLNSSVDVPRLSVSTGFSWGSAPKGDGSARPGESDDSDSDEEITEKPKTKKTRQERMAEVKLEEQKLFERERMLMLGDQAPETVADYNRLLLQSPDSSMVWLRYMAFHLETSEVEKAKAVAERALKTISYREEQEKQNVWVAYLNLEHMYGTADSLDAVFKRALQHNEPISITKQLIQIYAKSGSVKAAEDLYSGLARRHSMNKDVWISFGSFYFQHDQSESARKLMQRALKSLEKKEHVELIAKFAQMEFKQGEPERGKTIFENLLSSYPRRTDLWSVYIDMITKLGELEPIRQLYERVINLKLSAKKMRFFFKKYLSFEERHGDEDTVNAIKLKAMEYVESKSQSVS